MKNLICGLLLITLFANCGDEIDTRPPQVQIDEYLTEMGLTAQTTASGLNYIIEEEGTGTARPGLNDVVHVKYRGTLLNGDQFDANDNAMLEMSRVIAGWQEGMQLMKKDGKAKFLIPPAIGYGNNPVGPIPASSVLVFDVELFDF